MPVYARAWARLPAPSPRGRVGGVRVTRPRRVGRGVPLSAGISARSSRARKPTVLMRAVRSHADRRPTPRPAPAPPRVSRPAILAPSDCPACLARAARPCPPTGWRRPGDQRRRGSMSPLSTCGTPRMRAAGTATASAGTTMRQVAIYSLSAPTRRAAIPARMMASGTSLEPPAISTLPRFSLPRPVAWGPSGRGSGHVRHLPRDRARFHLSRRRPVCHQRSSVMW